MLSCMSVNRADVLLDLRVEQVVRELAMNELFTTNRALDLAVHGLAEVLHTDEDQLPAVAVHAVSVEALVLVAGETEKRTVTIDLHVGEPDSEQPKQLADSTTSDRDVEPEIHYPHLDLHAAAESPTVARRVRNMVAHMSPSPEIMALLVETMNALASLTPDQLEEARHRVLVQSASPVVVAEIARPKMSLSEWLLSYFRDHQDVLLTMADIWEALPDELNDLEYEDVRRAVVAMHRVRSELMRPTRKSWLWTELIESSEQRDLGPEIEEDPALDREDPDAGPKADDDENDDDPDPADDDYEDYRLRNDQDTSAVEANADPPAGGTA